jgi:hypothetical protein
MYSCKETSIQIVCSAECFCDFLARLTDRYAFKFLYLASCSDHRRSKGVGADPLMSSCECARIASVVLEFELCRFITFVILSSICL